MSKAWHAHLAGQAPAPYPAPKLKAHQPARPLLLPYCLVIPDAAAYLGISPRTLADMLAKGKLPSALAAGRRVVRRADLEAYIDRQVDDQFRFRLPETMGQARAAARDAMQQAEALRAQAKRAKDAEVAEFLYLANRALLQLALFFRWNAGIGEFDPEAIYAKEESA